MVSIRSNAHFCSALAVTCPQESDPNPELVPSGGKRPSQEMENSWGRDVGEKGYYVMSPQWFRDNVFEVVVDRSTVPPEIAAVETMEPIPLPPWDPMGALARDGRGSRSP